MFDPTRVLGLSLSVKTWLIIAAAVAVAVLGIAAGSYGYGYGSGKAKATEEAAAERAASQQRVAEANEKNREQEKVHELRIRQLLADFVRADEYNRGKDARTIADLRSGNQRMRLRIATCHPAQSGEAGPAPGGADGAGTAELAPETSAALWGIAADGDRAIRKLTGLQAWARSAVQLCSGLTPPGGE